MPECVALAMTGLVWRCSYLLRMGGPWSDELYSAFTTLAALDLPAVPPFLVETNYVLPIAPLASVPLRAAGLETMLWVRMPHVLASLTAVLVWHCVMRRYLPRTPAIVTSCWLLVGNSSVLFYSTAAISYGVVQLGVASLVITTLRYGELPNRWRAATLSTIAALNVSHYALTAVVALPALLAVFFSWDQLRNAESVLRQMSRRRLFASGIAAVAFVSSVALAVYRPLTQGVSYRGGWLEPAAAAMALFLAAVIGISLKTVLARLVSSQTIRRGSWLLLPGLLSAALLQTYAHWYAEGYPGWNANAATWQTSLRHVHEYGGQVRLLLEGVLPAYLFGHLSTLVPGVTTYGQLSFAAVPSMLFLVLIAIGLWGLVRGGVSAKSSAIGWVLSVPVLLLVVTPSWKLFGDYAFRYLLICSGPLALCAVSGIQFFHPSRWPVGVILGGLTLYGAADAWRNVPRELSPEWQAARQEWTVLDNLEVGALVSADEEAPYVRVAANRDFAVYAQNATRFRYVMTGGTPLCAHERIAVSVSASFEEWPFPTTLCEFDELPTTVPLHRIRLLRRVERR